MLVQQKRVSSSWQSVKTGGRTFCESRMMVTVARMAASTSAADASTKDPGSKNNAVARPAHTQANTLQTILFCVSVSRPGSKSSLQKQNDEYLKSRITTSTPCIALATAFIVSKIPACRIHPKDWYGVQQHIRGVRNALWEHAFSCKTMTTLGRILLNGTVLGS